MDQRPSLVLPLTGSSASRVAWPVLSLTALSWHAGNGRPELWSEPAAVFFRRGYWPTVGTVIHWLRVFSKRALRDNTLPLLVFGRRREHDSSMRDLALAQGAQVLASIDLAGRSSVHHVYHVNSSPDRVLAESAVSFVAHRLDLAHAFPYGLTDSNGLGVFWALSALATRHSASPSSLGLVIASDKVLVRTAPGAASRLVFLDSAGAILVGPARPESHQLLDVRIRRGDPDAAPATAASTVLDLMKESAAAAGLALDSIGHVATTCVDDPVVGHLEPLLGRACRRVGELFARPQGHSSTADLVGMLAMLGREGQPGSIVMVWGRGANGASACLTLRCADAPPRAEPPREVSRGG